MMQKSMVFACFRHTYFLYMQNGNLKFPEKSTEKNKFRNSCSTFGSYNSIGEHIGNGFSRRTGISKKRVQVQF